MTENNDTHQNDNDNTEAMQINPQRAKQLIENLTGITKRIDAVNKSGRKVIDHHSIWTMQGNDDR